MSQPSPRDSLIDTWQTIVKAQAAHRILPEHLKVYVDLETASVDWLGLIERVGSLRFGLMLSSPAVEDCAAVALVAHLLGFAEALRVGPYDTVAELLAIVDRATQVEFLAGVQLTITGINL